MSVGSEEKIMCHTSIRVHVIILITWILTDTGKSKNIQKNIKFGWKIRIQHQESRFLDIEMCTYEKAKLTYLK